MDSPHDINLEQAILGTMLVRKGAIDQFAGIIEARHFFDPLHQRIFDMAVYLQTEGDVTPVVLGSVLRNDPAKGEVPIQDYIQALASASPAAPSIPAMSGQLKDIALLRQLHQIGGNLAKLVIENPDQLPGAKIADAFTEEMLLVTSDTQRPTVSPYDAARESIKEIEDAASGKHIPVIGTGIGPLDRELGGLRGGDLVTILGKSGMGKSALMCRLSLLMASAGIPTIVFSLEMSQRQWVERMVCDLDFDTAPAPLWYSRVRNHRLRDGEFDRFVLAAQRLQDLPLTILDEGGLGMGQISARARAFAAKHKGKRIAVIGDYLQLVEPEDQRENRERQVARIAYGLKLLAKRIDALVIFGSQMNENDEARREQERRPRASDARESRGIMNASDIMLAPYRAAAAVENRRPLAATDDSPEMVAWFAELAEVRHSFDLLCLKNRHGRRFDLKLWAEIGANAIRDEKPDRMQVANDEDVQGLLAV